MKIDTIVIEGVDKTGKDTLLKYIDMIGNHRYAIYTRGNISNIVYAKAFNRNVNNYKMHPHIFYVLLTGEKDDLDINKFDENDFISDYESGIIRNNYPRKMLVINSAQKGIVPLLRTFFIG